MAKDFVTISKKECLEVYKELITSQERHFKSAEALANIEEYGQAISHLILGSEELVKGLILYLDGIGLRIRSIKGVKKFFRDHRTRHFTAGVFMFLSQTIKPLMTMVERFRVLLHQPTERENMTALEKTVITNDKEAAEKITKEWTENEGKLMFEKMMIQMDFWQEADDLKQLGLYVDYNEKLLLPRQLTKVDYENAYFSTSIFCDECKSLIKYFESTTEDDRTAFALSVNKYKMYNVLESFLNPTKSNIDISFDNKKTNE